MSETTPARPRIKGHQNSSKFIFRKRDPPKPSTKKTDVYITNKSSFKYNLDRLEKLWTDGEKEINVHALGAAIPRAVNLCLQFQRQHQNFVHLEVTTGCVNLVDDLIPTTEDEDFETSSRKNSSIHVKIERLEDKTKSSGSEKA